jgi:hypothetical protein
MRPLRTVAILALLLAARAAIWPDGASAQKINFDQINKFESLGTGTLHVGAPPKTIIDDASDTSWYSRSGTPMPRQKSIGAYRMETIPAQR